MYISIVERIQLMISPLLRRVSLKKWLQFIETFRFVGFTISILEKKAFHEKKNHQGLKTDKNYAHPIDDGGWKMNKQAKESFWKPQAPN